jgi:thiosulfate/3-mercaptopyruvate sulfurtransferase
MRFFLATIAGVALALTLTGCPSAPTKIYRRTQGPTLSAEALADAVIVDGRSAFAVGAQKIDGSVAVRAQDFWGLSDPQDLSRRLALKGLSPDKKVVVFDDGPSAGKGEAGALAWILLYLGFEKIQTASVESARLVRDRTGDGSSFQESPVANAKPWTPVLRKHLLANANEVKKNASGKKPQDLHVIDVRSEKDYLQAASTAGQKLDPRAVNIPWNQLYAADGQPQRSMIEQLMGIGVRPSHRIVVTGPRTEAAAAAFALTALGFEQVGLVRGK